MNLKNSLKAV